MKLKKLLSLLLIVASLAVNAGQVGEWKSYLAYNNVREIAELGDEIFGLAGGSLFSVNTKDGDITYYNKQNSLNGSTIDHISANKTTGTLVIFYTDGLIDLMDKNGKTYAMTDLYLKDISSTKNTNHIWMRNEYAYCSMNFGIMVINLKKKEITGVYYVGENGKETNILQTTATTDSIYAISENTLIAASLKDNLQDYNNWKKITLPDTVKTIQSIAALNNNLYSLQDRQLYKWQNGKWRLLNIYYLFDNLRFQEKIYCTADSAVYELNNDKLTITPLVYSAYDVIPKSGEYWIAADTHGIAFHDKEKDEFYKPQGPAVNEPYRMKFAYDKLYVVPGARWATESGKPAYVMIYDGFTWTNITYEYITSATGYNVTDFMNVAVDPNDNNHFVVTSYGKGLFEFYGDKLTKVYTYTNSPLKAAATGAYEGNYVRTDAAMYDKNGNLYLVNTSSRADNLHIISPAQMEKAHTATYAKWDTINFYQNGERVTIYTPQEMFIDRRYENWKWIPTARSSAGLLLFDDNNTIYNKYDDRSYFRTNFTDQDNNSIQPEAVYCAVQDYNNDIWIGTNAGIITIPSSVDFRTSNSCERIKIARNDGTNLADYLLNTEQVNAIAIDGSNRKWIATESSGLYLMSADGITTIEHFTTDNSPILSDKVISLAIDPKNGLVYIGTEKGIMSYQSDASEPKEDYSNIYAFPNPVREDYYGVITITGLMDETVIHITDNGGNVVYETRGNGGLAVWNGSNKQGEKVRSGIYTVFCNTADGKNHTVIKIMIIN